MANYTVTPADVIENEEKEIWPFAWHKLSAGDTVYLEGNFDELKISRATRLTITSNKNVTIKKLILTGCTDTVFNGKNMIVISSEYGGKINIRPSLVNILDCHDTTLEKCIIYSTGIDNLKSEKDWRMKTRHGIDVARGSSCTVRNNKISEVYVAIQLRSPDSSASCNVIDNFCGDGIYLRRDRTKAIQNIIAHSFIDCKRGENCDGDDKKGNHNDAIQIIGKEIDKDNKIYNSVSDAVIDDNYIYNPIGTGFDEETHGIGSYNSVIIRLQVKNNKLLTNHEDGISLEHANACTVEGNTVLSLGSWVKAATIKIKESKNNNTVRNNQLEQNAVIILEGTQTNKNNSKLSENDRQNEYEEITDAVSLGESLC